MPVYAALLQGVNIGPRKRIAMADLRALLEAAGGGDVATYANSGNAVFRHDDGDALGLERRLEDVVGAHVGLPVPVLLRTAEELAGVVAANPFPELAAEPKHLHVVFLRAKPTVEAAAAVESAPTGEDRVALVGRHLYAALPHGMSGATVDLARLGAGLGRGADGWSTTARNWTTVTTLARMAGGELS